MKILDRYILRFFWSSYGICLGSFLTLFVLVDAIQNLQDLLEENTSLLWAFFLRYGAELPIIFQKFAPFITLAGAMFAVSRLQRNNELLPMRAAGISGRRIALPLFGVGLLLSGILVLDQELVIPRTAEIVRRHQEEVYAIFLPDKEKNFFRVSRYDPGSRQVHSVNYTERHPNGMERMTINAARGEWEGDGWRLYDGRIRWFDSRGRQLREPEDPSRVRMEEIPDEGIRIETSIRPLDIELRSSEPAFLTTSQLLQVARLQPDLQKLMVRFHQRLAFPVANLVLLLLGLPFVLATERRNLYLNLLVCLVICGIFFLLTASLADLGDQGVVPPILAAWGPNLFFIPLGLWMARDIN